MWPDEGDGVVELQDGRRVRGRGLGRGEIEVGDEPGFGVYLLPRDPGAMGWESRWVRWPDFRTPADSDDAIAALREAHRRAATERVEIACRGGVGRTGTAMAVLARLSGVPADQSVAWVRAHYNPRAVETPWQKRWARIVAL